MHNTTIFQKKYPNVVVPAPFGERRNVVTDCNMSLFNVPMSFSKSDTKFLKHIRDRLNIGTDNEHPQFVSNF